MLKFAQKLSLLLLVLLLAACDQGRSPFESVAVVEPTPTLQPTPTLAGGALPPAPPVSPGTSPADSQEAGPVTTEDGEGNNGRSDPAPGQQTAQPTPTPGITATPSPTPQPVERLTLGRAALDAGNEQVAISHYTAVLNQPESLSPAQIQEALYHLGVAYQRSGSQTSAVSTFTQLLDLAPTQAPAVTHFYLAQAHQQLGEHEAALAAYERYLESHPETAAYVRPYMATVHLAQGNREAARRAYEAALDAPAHYLTQIEIRQELVEFYLADRSYEAAIAQYDAIRDLAQTEATKGRMTYLAGAAEQLRGSSEAAYARYLEGVQTYPRAYESYLGLVELVNNDQPVDEFQRGLVNYYATVYEPAVAAFGRYMEANPETYRADTHLYRAWSYEGLGNLEAALAELDRYALAVAPQATMERGRMLARAGQPQQAIAAYLSYLEQFPDGPDAAFCAWWAAVLTEREGETETAVTRYLFLADNYSWHDDAPQALFRAGFLQLELGQTETAVATWIRLTQTYPNRDESAAALVWLLRTVNPDQFTGQVGGPVSSADAATLPQAVEQWATSSRSAGYYALRARDLINDVTPFHSDAPFTLPAAPDEGQAAAETWLRQQLELGSDTAVSDLSSTLRQDNRLIVGQQLWQMGLFEEAKRELEGVRQAQSGHALHSYQLALFFRDLGLYRSSILAATSLLGQTGHTVFEAPVFIGRLLYPVYYADLIMPLAERYGFDPRLQFALVRQESLFESFARSHAAAQGLSQVIPDTGAWIANRLNWPNYRNEDLYRPYVGLEFGSYYLDQQLQNFDGHVHAALAAYNAGPGNAARWYQAAGGDHDEYVETVNFAETTLYIERIYSGFVIYTYLYGGEVAE
ncbi:MAG: transglycosylase SLT domain-containing protein [Chloroflexota bacterium]